VESNPEKGRTALPLISTWLATSAFVDVFIAVAMTVILLKAKSGLRRRSNDMVNSLVRLVIETGILTASVAIIDVVFFTARSDTLLHECPALVLAKLYANTLLVNLNNRAFMRRGEAFMQSSADYDDWSTRRSFPVVFAQTDGTTNRSNPVRVDVLHEEFTSSIPLDVPQKKTYSSSHTFAGPNQSEDGKASLATVSV